MRRRYKQFDALHQQLRSAFRGLPALPGKSGVGELLGNKDETARAEGRREGCALFAL